MASEDKAMSAYDKSIYNMIAKGTQMHTKLVFDIGANNGDDAAEYLKRGCKVVAVEANPELCDGMQERFAAEIEIGQLILIDKAISRRRTVTLYINSADHGWGTTLPSYAERGARLRGTVKPVEVETTTVIDLIRAYGVPDRMKVDIEGADILCLLDLYDGDLPAHLSIERPKSLDDQLFALTLLRRMGYAKFAFVDQTVEGERIHTTTGLASDDLPSAGWMSFAAARSKNLWLYGVWALSGLARRVPGMKAVAPRTRWFDIHAVRAA
jgi:FkbM family methyltransferase